MQYKAGYFLNSIFDLFLNQSGKEKVEKIVFQLCHFDLETNDEIKHQQVNYISEIKLVNNLISRGAPTRPSTFIEDLLATTFNFTKRELSSQNQISHPFINDALTEPLYRAIHIIDPRINKANQFIDIGDKWKQKGAGFKLDFLYSLVPEYLGPAYIQLIEENRDFSSLIKSSGLEENNEIIRNFGSILNQKNDFVLEMPYVHNQTRGITIDIDDTPTETKYEFEIDNLKKALCQQISWSEPLEIETHKLAESNSLLRPVMNFTYNEYFDTITKNYRNPVYNSSEGLNALQYALSPIAVARIQKTVIEYLLSGKLSLNAEVLKIGVIERDVPCAYIAFQDLWLHFENIFALEGKNIKLPEIKLSIYRTDEFKNAKLNLIYTGTINSIESFDTSEDFDLLIDISMLQRNGIVNTIYETKSKNKAIIKSVKSIHADREIYTDKSISYLDIFSQKTDKKLKTSAIDAYKYFLRNIFRKDDFLTGQLELINKSSKLNNCLGILPSGGGKSIAYQLASFLQPGISLVINPNSSVTTDQLFALQKSGIDCMANFNPVIKNEESLKRVLSKLENLEYLIAFISPEFLRRKEVRDTLITMEKNSTLFSHFIVDEAHCLSEWSHDFRLNYHKLGELKEQLLKNNNKQNITTIALSATVSTSCKVDILAELQIDKENIVEISEQYSNLNFNIINATTNQIKPDMSIGQIRQLIGARKQVHFSFLIKEIFREFKEKNKKNSTLIYCPTAYGNTGVSDNYGDGLTDKLKTIFEGLKIASFWGVPDELAEKVLLKDLLQSAKNQNKFLNNEIDMLVAAPSFGIGINKQDIRNLIYFSPPDSIESFIQQTQRVGRDRNEATCSVLIENQEFDIPENSALSGYTDITKTTFDKYLAYEKIIKKFKGQDKELAVIQELLSGAKADKTTYLDIIHDSIEDAFNIDTDLQPHPANKPVRLYVKCQEKTFGYVDLLNFNTNIDESNFEQETSRNLLNFTAEELRRRYKNTDAGAKILNSELYKLDIEGIESILDRLKTGEIAELSIPYTNDALSSIAEILQKELSTTFTKNRVKELYTTSLSKFDFIEKINLIKSIDIQSNLAETIVALYNSVRLKTESLTAIYRLSKLGFIDDYIVDEIDQQFIIKIRKKANEAHLLKLYTIFESFLLPEKASEMKLETDKITGNYIKKTIEGYIHFCYQFIVKERFNSIENLNNIFAQAIIYKDNTNEFNREIQLLFANYFSAKYTSSFFGLIPVSNNQKDGIQDFSVIESNLVKLGPLKENWIQLKKSNELISKIMPNNPIPFLLDAYTNLVSGEKDDQAIDKAFDQIARGFIKIRKMDNYQPDKYQSNIQSFLDLLYQHRPDLKETYDSILWLRLHYIWLKDFNKKSIENG